MYSINFFLLHLDFSDVNSYFYIEERRCCYEQPNKNFALRLRFP